MRTYNPVRHLLDKESIVFLVIAMVIGIFLIAALTLTLLGRYLDEVEAMIDTNVLESRKMRLNSDLMEIARSRTRLTSQIIDTEDPFMQDELNLVLEEYAGRFSKLREQLVNLPLSEHEKKVLIEEHGKIVPVILPAQRQVVELAMSDDVLDRKKGREILYNIVLPGQQKMIDSFGKLISLQQERISDVAKTSTTSMNKVKRSGIYLIGISFLVTTFFLLIVVIRIRSIQAKLRMANINLENIVLERTDQLLQARDKLSEYVDVLDKYVITSSTDKHGVITKTSEAFCRISQYDENELIGNAHNIVRHADMPASIYEEMWRTIKQGKAWRGEIKNKAKDGSAYWVDVNIEPTFDGNGEIIGYTAIRQDITDKKLAEQLAVTDPLTNLFNRLKLDEVINQEIERILRYPNDLSVIIFDVDHFKHVNDTYGHQAGDTVLVSISEIVTSRARDTDIIGRWGGEEFLIICVATNITGAQHLAEDVRMAISNHIFGEVGSITSSFGVASFRVNESMTNLIKRADEALYRAKDAGRNRVVVDD